MKCPECGLENPPQAIRCDCGHDFRMGSADSPTTPTETPLAVFEAQRMGFLRRQKWTVHLTPDAAVFSCSEGEGLVRVSKVQANACIQFTSAFVVGYNLAVKPSGTTYKFKLARDDLSKLRAWMPKKTAADMKGELRKWGTGLIVLGVAHFVLADFLSPGWGGIILAVGVLNLLIPQRGMFVVNGLALLLVGILNVFAGEVGTWTVYGLLQLAWGVQEMRKFGQYASAK